jgi:hypothetical protein
VSLPGTRTPGLPSGTAPLAATPKQLLLTFRFGLRFDLDDLMRPSLPRSHCLSMIEQY